MTAGVATLTARRLEEHFRQMLPSARLVPLDDLSGDVGLACVDGRREHCTAGAPGGNAGLLILLLAAWEEGADPLSPDAVDGVFARYLEHFGAFYLHTDRVAQDRLAAALGVGRGAAVDALVAGPPEATRARLLDALLDPAHVGCGHLRLLLEEPEAYGVRPDLVRAVLRAFFLRLWSGDGRLVLEVLDGPHKEVGVAVVRTEGAPALVTACPRHGAVELFVYHPDAVAWLQALHAVFLARQGFITPDRIPACIAAQRRLGDRQLEATLQRLAPSLPVFDVRLEPGNGSTVAGVTVRHGGRAEPVPPLDLES
jgi:hypothetical protein